MFAHDVNDVCELTDADAKRLIESGHVEPFEEKAEKPEKPAKSSKK
jgi:hypothetical protein